MLNQQIIIGRLGRDVEAVNTTSGTSISKFSVAASDKYKGEETTEWFNCVAFGKTAEFAASYLGKGNLVYISAKRRTQKWQDKEGRERESFEYIINELKNLTPKSDKAAPVERGYQSSGEESLPF
jgi:single-strand DNA-binding protein